MRGRKRRKAEEREGAGEGRGGPSVVSFLPSSVPSSLPFSSSFASLAWLLHPLSLHEFFAEYWERRPLHIQRKDRHYYGALLKKSDIDAFIASNEDKLAYGTDLNLCRCDKGKVRIDRGKERRGRLRGRKGKASPHIFSPTHSLLAHPLLPALL